MTLAETMEDIADALAPVAAEIDGLQVYPFLNPNPTPPAWTSTPARRSRQGPGSVSASPRCGSPSGPGSAQPTRSQRCGCCCG